MTKCGLSQECKAAPTRYINVIYHSKRLNEKNKTTRMIMSIIQQSSTLIHD